MNVSNNTPSNRLRQVVFSFISIFLSAQWLSANIKMNSALGFLGGLHQLQLCLSTVPVRDQRVLFQVEKMRKYKTVPGNIELPKKIF